MRPLRYSINVTLDGCCDHRADSMDEELHRYWAENLARADALLFGRVTYEMMEAAWRPAASGVKPDWYDCPRPDERPHCDVPMTNPPQPVLKLAYAAPEGRIKSAASSGMPKCRS
jgi:hypothetical protein